jgi:hypothetical protein
MSMGPTSQTNVGANGSRTGTGGRTSTAIEANDHGLSGAGSAKLASDGGAAGHQPIAAQKNVSALNWSKMSDDERHAAISHVVQSGASSTVPTISQSRNTDGSNAIDHQAAGQQNASTQNSTDMTDAPRTLAASKVGQTETSSTSSQALTSDQEQSNRVTRGEDSRLSMPGQSRNTDPLATAEAALEQVNDIVNRHAGIRQDVNRILGDIRSATEAATLLAQNGNRVNELLTRLQTQDAQTGRVNQNDLTELQTALNQARANAQAAERHLNALTHEVGNGTLQRLESLLGELRDQVPTALANLREARRALQNYQAMPGQVSPRLDLQQNVPGAVDAEMRRAEAALRNMAGDFDVTGAGVTNAGNLLNHFQAQGRPAIQNSLDQFRRQEQYVGDEIRRLSNPDPTWGLIPGTSSQKRPPNDDDSLGGPSSAKIPKSNGSDARNSYGYQDDQNLRGPRGPASADRNRIASTDKPSPTTQNTDVPDRVSLYSSGFDSRDRLF